MVFLIFFLAHNDASLLHRCGSLELGTLKATPMTQDKGNVELEERDPFKVPNQLASEHFVLRWGNDWSPTNPQEIIDMFEHSWDVQIHQLGYVRPESASVYKLNVYFGDTGNGTPTHYGYGGYIQPDNLNNFYIVLNPILLNPENRNALRSTIPHEFFHTIQTTYAWNRNIAWWGEATADWVIPYVFPDEFGFAEYLPGFAYFPHLPLDYWSLPEPGSGFEWSQLHQYGTFIFARYLSESLGDEVIKTSWENLERSGIQPILTLISMLGQETFHQMFSDFSIQNIDWNYRHGFLYEIVYPKALHESPSYRIVASHEDASGTWLSPPVETLPHRFGTNYIVLKSQEGHIRIYFEGEEAGLVDWKVQVLHLKNRDRSIHKMEVFEGKGNVIVNDVSKDDEVWLSICTPTDSYDSSKQYGYRYKMESIALGYEAVFPHITNPNQGWDNSISVLNNNSQEAFCEVQLVLADGLIADSIPLMLQPFQAIQTDLPSWQHDSDGYVLLRSNANMQGMLSIVQRSSGSSLSVPLIQKGLLSGIQTRLLNEGTSSSGHVWVNPHSFPIEIKQTLTASNGTILGTTVTNIEGRHKFKATAGELFFDTPHSYLTFQASHPVFPLAIQFANQGQMSLIPTVQD